MGLCNDTSLRDFLSVLKYIKISFSIHLAAYVANLVPFPTLKLSTPLINPIVPMEIKSSVYSPVLSNFFTIWATSRKLCSINLFLASLLPSSISLIYFNSSSVDKGWGNVLFFTYETKNNVSFIKNVNIVKKVDTYYRLH